MAFQREFQGGLLHGNTKGFSRGLPAWPFKGIFRGAPSWSHKGVTRGAFCMASQRDSQKGYSQNGDLRGARLRNESGGCYLKRLIKHAFFMFDLFFWILDLDIGMVFWGIPLGRFLVVLRFKNQIPKPKIDYLKTCFGN